MNACLFCRLQIKRELYFLTLSLTIHYASEFLRKIGTVIVLKGVICVHDFRLGLEASFDIGLCCAEDGVDMEGPRILSFEAVWAD